jgi:hypothetical protein
MPLKMAKVWKKLVRSFPSIVNGEGQTVWSDADTLSQKTRDREKELERQSLKNYGHVQWFSPSHLISLNRIIVRSS